MDHQGEKWTTVLGRIGRLAQGLIFVSIGLLSTLAALRGNPHASDSRGALRTIVEQPFGKAILLALIVGLGCYVLWRALVGLIDLEHKGTDAKGLALRARSLFIAFVYGGITWAAVKILLGAGGGTRGNESARDWTAKGLSTPFGSWIVALVGVAVVAGGLYQCFRAYRGRFEKQLRLEELSDDTRTLVTRICAFGIGARGIVFAIVGVGLVRAGLQSNAAKAHGLSGALDTLHAQPYGRWLFAIVAAGLAAYGVYCCVCARYGRFGS